MKVIPYGRQYIDNKDISFVSKALKEDLITTGRYVKKFEKRVSKFLKAKYIVSCNSGTAALHLALMAIHVKKNDIIIMPAINFIAVYNMARIMNAKIFLADVDPLTGQMTPKTLLDCVKKYKLKKIKAIITMYLGGYPENVIEFYKIKKKLNCYLIEDACHALGAKYFYNNKYFHIGSCKHSDISTFSLHPVKTITTGEGGLVTTNNKLLHKSIISFRSHGIKKKFNYHWKYNINNVGFNYRLSDINCALGLSQLSKIQKFLKYRKKIYNYYREQLKDYKKNISFPNYNTKNNSAYHLFVISLNSKNLIDIKERLLKFCLKKKILCQYHYIPIYKFNFFNKSIRLKNYQGAEYYYKNSLSLPIFYNLKKNLLIKVISHITFLFKKKKINRYI
jgi:dTDP-4-amino-4,6-dideoxygalactose transaminase